MKFWHDSMTKILHQVPDKPGLVQIEFTNYCNLSCTVCPRNRLPIEKKEMPWETFIAILDNLQRLHLKRIDLGGWGEVTTHSRFRDAVRECHLRHFEYSFTTNGMKLNDSLAGWVLGNPPVGITFSIDELETGPKSTGHKNAPAIKNLRYIQDQTSRPRINVNTLVQKSNHDKILALIETMNGLRIDMLVLFGPNKATDEANLRLPQEVEWELYQQIEKMKPRWRMVVSTPFDRYAKGQRRMWYRYGTFCAQTFQNIYINVKGDITPCCLLPVHSLGRLDNFATAVELFHSAKFQQFRRQQIRICKGCDVHRLATYEQ